MFLVVNRTTPGEHCFFPRILFNSSSKKRPTQPTSNRYLCFSPARPGFGFLWPRVCHWAGASPRGEEQAMEEDHGAMEGERGVEGAEGC